MCFLVTEALDAAECGLQPRRERYVAVQRLGSVAAVAEQQVVEGELAWDTQGCRVGACGCRPDPSGCRPDARGCRPDARGCSLDAWGESRRVSVPSSSTVTVCARQKGKA